MRTQNLTILSGSGSFLRIRPRYGCLAGSESTKQAHKQRVFPMSVPNLSFVPAAEKGCHYFERVLLTQVEACH